MKKRTFSSLLDQKSPIVWITAYDYPMALCCEAAGVEMILVGDSGGMVQLGYDNTVPVTMDEMIMMCKAVRRGAPNTFIVGDMPMGSYEISKEQAIANAIRFIKEGGCDAVKVEGGNRIADKVKSMTDAGITVIGHLGFTPQSMSVKIVKKSELLVQESLSLKDAGVSMILYEALTDKAMEYVYSANIGIKCMGIGSGLNTDGQLLILHDILGFYDKFKPRFAKNYMEQFTEATKGSKIESLLSLVKGCIVSYSYEVKSKKFPTEEYTYHE